MRLVGNMNISACCRQTPPRHAGFPRANESGQHVDITGWVMITVMTAIVVIALLAVFRQQVVTAVQNAFESVSNAR